MVVVDSSSGSPFRSIRATWPFIVIYTIINDTGHHREREKERDLRRFEGNSCLSKIILKPVLPDEQGTGLSVRQLKSFYEWLETSEKRIDARHRPFIYFLRQ